MSVHEPASEQPPPLRPAGISDACIMRVIRVPPEAAGMRLDTFLPTQLRNTSRTRARAIIERSAFSPSGKKLRPNDRVHAEQRVVLWRAPFEEPDQAGPLPVLYEDEHVLAVDKPPLMAVHPTARHHMSTVIVQLRARRPNEFLSLVHRIDRETSGILLVAKTKDSERAFKRMLEHRSVACAGAGREDTDVHKEYLAITWGVPEEGVVELPLALDSNNPLRVKMRVAQSGGLDARTVVTVLERKDRYALVRCGLHTGRQHQIRVHLAERGTPIVGDKLYGPDERMLARAADGELTEHDWKRLELPRHALHAHRYRMTHPVTGAPLEIVSPLPPDLSSFWASR
jgi:23S rRNA pseudouridine1911/1915/1917 synthase